MRHARDGTNDAKPSIPKLRKVRDMARGCWHRGGMHYDDSPESRRTVPQLSPKAARILQILSNRLSPLPTDERTLQATLQAVAIEIAGDPEPPPPVAG